MNEFLYKWHFTAVYGEETGWIQWCTLLFFILFSDWALIHTHIHIEKEPHSKLCAFVCAYTQTYTHSHTYIHAYTYLKSHTPRNNT